MTKNGIGHPHIDARSLALAKIVVERIDADPSLIEVAHRNLENEERRRGQLSRASREWKDILTRPLTDVRELLLKESDEGQRLRGSKPFVGILSEEERLEIIRRFPPPWRHVDEATATGPPRRRRKCAWSAVRTTPAVTPNQCGCTGGYRSGVRQRRPSGT